MSKLTLEDTFITTITKMSDGNLGAINALMQTAENLKRIDPQCVDVIMLLLFLDDMEIYGTDIYVLYNDKCNKDIRKFLMLMRAVQFGFLPQIKLKEMSKDQMREINLTEEEFNDLDDKVCAELEEFLKRQINAK